VDWLAAYAALANVSADTFDVMDQRISAAVVMAPLCSIFEPYSLRRIAAPVKIYTAQKDDLINNSVNGDWLRTQLDDVQFEEVANAGHFAFMAQFKKDNPFELNTASAGISHPNTDPDGFDRALFHQRLEKEVVLFFDQMLNAVAVSEQEK